jgi:hypothetical protein
MLRFEFAVVADLTANVLSVCLVVFLTLLPLTATPRQPAAPPAAERLLRITERRPLTGPDMVRLLHERSAPDAPASLDLFADRIELRGAGAAPRALSPDQLGGDTTPLRLFVLDPTLYPAVLDVLGQAGRIDAEMSVPDALRDPARPRLDWSGDFRRLDADALDRAAFERELARILDAAPPRVGRGDAAAAAGAGVAGLAARIGDRLAAIVDLGLRVGLPLGAIAWLLAAEIRRRRRALAVPFGMEAERASR